MDYIVHDEEGTLKDDHWDLWSGWFQEEPEDKKVDGTIYPVIPEGSALKDHIREARVFAIPLVGIESEEDIRTKIYDRLMAL